MNPVLRKDILTLLRLKRIAAIEILFVVLLAGLVLATWPRGGLLSMSASSQDDLLLGLVLGQLVVLVLVVPGVAAVSLTGEREANTFEMLYASRLNAFQIVAGKVMSAVAFPLLLILAGLPFVGLLNFRGAVNISDLLWSYLILLVTSVLLAVLSLTVSALCHQTSTALVMAYLAVLSICGGVLVPAAIMLDTAGGIYATILHWARAISPIAAVMSLLRPNNESDFAGRIKGNPPSHWIYLVAAAGVILVCLLVLLVRLRRPPAETDRSDDPNPKKQRRAFGTFNPMFSKERRTNRLSSGPWMIRIFYGMLVISFLLSVMSLAGGTEHPDLLRYLFQVLVTFQIVGVAIAPSLTAASISGEIETGNFEALRFTRLGGSKIFWGKFLPAFIPAVLPVIAMIPAFITVCYVELAYIQYLKLLLPIVLLAILFGCVLGMLCSTFTSNSARATVVAYIILSTLVVLPMLAWWAATAGMIDNEKLVGWLSMPSPLVIGLSLAPEAPAVKSQTQNISPFIAGLRVTHLYVMGGLCVAMLIVARLRLSFLLRRG